MGGYERLLGTDACVPEVFLNLAFAYWQVTDFGFNSFVGLEPDFIHHCEKRLEELLSEGMARFPQEPEVRFWRLYFSYISPGLAPFEKQALELAEQGTRVPYFYLFSESGGKRYRDEALSLANECQNHLTLKNRYILSIIEATTNRDEEIQREERKGRKEKGTLMNGMKIRRSARNYQGLRQSAWVLTWTGLVRRLGHCRCFHWSVLVMSISSISPGEWIPAVSGFKSL